MNHLDQVVAAQKRGEATGVTSTCSAHPLVLEAVLQEGKRTGAPVLIEATSNQVNQFGGYTGMKPQDFVGFVANMAEEIGLPQGQLILGGDHLGGTPWQSEPVAVAMEKSKVLVRDYVLAGFTKIHLDASMRLGDDPDGLLPVEVAAARAADLAVVAETAMRDRGDRNTLRYVIGTEVPIAGGLQEAEETLQVSAVPDLVVTLQETRKAFVSRGMEAAWQRVIAVVVQPGVEYGDTTIHEYDREAAADLVRFIEEFPLVYEAHSTDYQTRWALRHLVEDHFSILKVGPALTFAAREAIFGLALIENELLPSHDRSNLVRVLDHAMIRDPIHWQKHYRGDTTSQLLSRRFSFSDRCRYYWMVLDVQTALRRLVGNLARRPIPLTLLSQFMPLQYGKVRDGSLDPFPMALIKDNVLEIFRDYQFATGQLTTHDTTERKQTG